MLTESDAQLMALKQLVQQTRAKIEQVIVLLEEGDVFDGILELKKLNDFTLGDFRS